ncbi:MAG: ABC transporter ATP-binding protein [Spirochaetales bacterium]|nr:ABC transporter ATP-binding protein [Spirochaetales bacterium]
MESIIEFRHFGFKYTSQAEPTLYDINLRINKGEKVLICGPSGCGKSTLSHCINGLIPQSYSGEATGELLIDGKSFTDYDIFKLSKIVGTVLQDSDAQFIGLTVGEDIAFALENDSVSLGEMRSRVSDVADLVGVQSHLMHAPHELSGGLKQRVSLAGVMVDDVSVLLFDEPLANLDPATGKTAIELIDDIHSSTGKTVIIIEHRLEDVLHRYVDRIILMQEGRIVADMSPSELLCSDLLAKAGIREPLYITALRYAGVAIRPQINPQSIDAISLSDAEVAKVRTWYQSVPVASVPDDRPVILEAENVDFSYDGKNVALKDINVSIRRGEMMSIVGRNGAGKSTFAKVICGFERQQNGKILLNGLDMDGLSIKERAGHIGYVMQNPNQMISKSMIRDEVGLGLKLRGKLSQEDIDAKVDEVLRICGLYEFRNWPISALSYGQKKRVTIASILSLDPQIIILDEPTAGQDFRHYTEIMEFLRQLNERGVTIILITHDMHLMLEYCTRAVVFSDTRKIADKSCEEVLTDQDTITRANLKETSLARLSSLCGIADETDFIRRFISVDRSARAEEAEG